jgi:prepilin-type N-terminal cleavage/methylation domain-containing protein
MRRRYLRGQHGMTLVELMVVVAIIAVIAAIAMSLYQDIQKKAQVASDEANVSAMRSAIAIYYGRTNGFFPTSTVVDTLVIPAPVWICGTPTYDTGNGKVTYTATTGDCP